MSAGGITVRGARVRARGVSGFLGGINAFVFHYCTINVVFATAGLELLPADRQSETDSQ